MEIILTQNVDKLGRKGEVKTVKDGYYMNFLAPRGLAKAATPKLLAWAEKMREQAIKEKEQIAEEAGEIKKTLEKLTIKLEEKTTDKDTLYGSIGEKELVKALEDQAKLKLKKKQLEMEPIKTVGSHKVNVKLTDDVVAELTVEVKAK